MAKSYNKPEFSKLPLKNSIYVFLIVFVLEFAGGIYLGYFKGILLNDAFSRTANAFYVLYVKPLRLASVGFVWNPLPSIMQLPLVEMSKLWRPIVSSGISSSFVTAVSAAFGAVILLKAFVHLGVERKYYIPLTVLYAANPFIFFYGMNGMSEEVFFIFVIYAVTNLTFWMKEGKPEYIVKIAFSLTLAFFCRYEAIPFAAGIGLAVLVNIFLNKNEKKFVPENIKHERYYYAEGTAIVLYAPLIYGILIWVFLNWTITGNPLYFLNSSYSNEAQSQLTRPVGSLFAILKYVFVRSLPFLPLFFGVVVERFATRRLLKSDFFMLCAIAASLISFHFLMLVKGSSYGWLRFFSYVLPITAAWIPYEISDAKEVFRRDVSLILVVALLVSGIFTAKALSDPVLAVEEQTAVVSSRYLDISKTINDELSDNRVMMDSFVTSSIILNVKNTDNLIISNSLYFNTYIKDPAKYNIQYIIVPDPNSGVGSLDAFNVRYPDLYKNGAEWCTLYKEFDGYKIFKVID